MLQCDVPDIGAAKAIYYDIAALRYCINYCKSEAIDSKAYFLCAGPAGLDHLLER